MRKTLDKELLRVLLFDPESWIHVLREIMPSRSTLDNRRSSSISFSLLLSSLLMDQLALEKIYSTAISFRKYFQSRIRIAMCEHSKQENHNYFSLSFKQVAQFEQIRLFYALYRIYQLLFFRVLIPIVLSNDLYYVKL